MTSMLAASGDTGSNINLDLFGQADGSYLPVTSSVNKVFRAEFTGTSLNTTRWTPTQTGSGMSYTVANGALSINTGTTVDDEIIFTSTSWFSIPMRATVGLSLSQRIAGQSFYVEFVSVDPTTLIPDANASVAAWNISGTTATNAAYEVSPTGTIPRLTSGASNITSTASGVVFEIETFNDECWFHTRTMDSATQRGVSYVRHQQIPDPNALYALRIRVRNRQYLQGITAVANNGSGLVRITRSAHGYTTGDTVLVENVAGATGANGTFTITVIDANNFDLVGSTFGGTYVNTGWAVVSKSNNVLTNTVMTVSYASVVDYVEQVAEITGGRGGISAGQGISVNVNTMPTTSVSAAGQQADNSSTVVNPVLVAAKAYTAAPTAATSGRAMSILATAYGAVANKPYSIPELDFQYAAATGGITNTTDVVAKAANVSLRNYVTSLSIINTSATATEFVVKDGATVIWRTNLPASMTDTINVVFPTPLRGTVNTALNIACITTGAAVYANLQGYQAV